MPGSGRSPGEGNGSPLQYSCLQNLMNRTESDKTERLTTSKEYLILVIKAEVSRVFQMTQERSIETAI